MNVFNYLSQDKIMSIIENSIDNHLSKETYKDVYLAKGKEEHDKSIVITTYFLVKKLSIYDYLQELSSLGHSNIDIFRFRDDKEEYTRDEVDTIDKFFDNSKSLSELLDSNDYKLFELIKNKMKNTPSPTKV